MTKLGFFRTILRVMSGVKRAASGESGSETGHEAKKILTEPSEGRLPKRKVALLMGYCGTGYHGMQVNPPHKTIEGDLFEALVKAGAISKDNSNDPKKSSLIRAARTDKGVHAAGNVVSLKMIVEDEDVVAKINSFLPEQIRLWGYTRTNRSFECRKVCSSRVYEYILPTYTLINPRKSTALGRAMASSKSTHLSESLSEESDKFWQAVDKELLEKGISREAIIEAAQEDTYGSDDNNGNEKEDNKLGYDRKLLRSVENSHRRSYRALPERIEYLRKALQQYKGVKNFHNFTVGKDFKDVSASRVMKSLSVSEPFVIDGTEWVSIKIHGQSFMLHQIRKMIALAVLVVRSGSSIDKVSKLFEPTKMSVPKAPALGLLLEQPVYDGYNQRLAKLGRDSVSFAPYEKEIQEFKEKFIYSRIYAQEAKENEFQAFFGFVDTYRTSDLLNFLLDIEASDAPVTSDKQLPEDEEDNETANDRNEG